MDAQLGKIPLSILFPYNLHYTTYMFTIRRSYGEVFYAPIHGCYVSLAAPPTATLALSVT